MAQAARGSLHAELTTAQRLKSIFSGSIGNLVEFFDWYVYSAFALYFAQVFFPGGDQTAQLLNAAAIFAVGFLMRPIGGWLLGIYADRHGRRVALLISVFAMCAGSFTIALLPGYATIGIAAPIILVLARLLQGLSLGGEYGSSATYLSELAPPKSRGFYSSFLYATLSMGQLLALAVLVILQQFVLTPEQLHDWGWRIPFAIGGILAVVAIYLRGNMTETESFRRHQSDASRNAGLRALAKHWRQCLVVAGLTLGGTVSFYAFTTYMQKFLVNTAGLDKNSATLAAAIGLLFFVCLQPVLGALSDKVGRRALLITFGVLGTLFTVPLFQWLSGVNSVLTALPPLLCGLTIVAFYTSVNAIAKAELFPVGIRALGVGLPYSITVSLFGGTAEYVALWFKTAGRESGFFWYVCACVACSLLCYLAMRDPKKYSEIDKD